MDRARTVQAALDSNAGPEDFVIPGHILPLAARPEGLAVRRGHTEGSVALARLSGLFQRRSCQKLWHLKATWLEVMNCSLLRGIRVLN